MVEKDALFKSKIKHAGVFDFKETYKVIFEWLVDQGYAVNEKSYKENIGAGGIKEIEIEWEATRSVSDYFQFQISAKWHITGMSSVEVEIDGNKQKMNKGQVELELKSTLLKDYEDRWSGKPLIKILRTMYDKYLIKERIEQYEGKLIGEMDELVAQCKSFLNLTGSR